MILLASILIGIAQPAVAAAPEVPPAPASERAASAEAIALAELLAGRELVLGAASRRQAREAMAALAERDPPMQAIEARTPGTIAAVVNAVMPIIERSAERRLPVLHQRLGALYDARFTPGEIGRLRDFYGSPTGRRFIQGMQARVDTTASIESASRRRDRMPESGAVLQDLGRAGEAAAAALSPADQRVLLELHRGGLLGKVEATNGEAMRTLLGWSQELSPEDQREIMTASQEIVRKRMAGPGRQ